MKLVSTIVLLMLCGLAHAGYDLHITRKTHWFDEVGPRITIAEWKAYMKRDGQITLDKANSEYDFIVKLSGEEFPIWYEPKLGELRTKDSSEKAIEKLIGISKGINARVQRDDGELYPRKP